MWTSWHRASGCVTTKAFAMQQTSLQTSNPTTSRTTADDRRRRIRDLNDQARQAWGVYPHTQTVLTTGVQILDEATLRAVVERVQNFNEFTSANDPHGEHDFGAFDFDGVEVFFKIDYLDKDLQFHSPDPGDPAVTERVITLMLAEEY